MPAISTTVLVAATDGRFTATFTPSLAVEQFKIVANLLTQHHHSAEIHAALEEVADKWPIKLDWKAV